MVRDGNNDVSYDDGQKSVNAPVPACSEPTRTSAEESFEKHGRGMFAVISSCSPPPPNKKPEMIRGGRVQEQ